MRPRQDILLRDRMIVRLYRQGISRKQIPLHIQWVPIMQYEAVKKVLQKFGHERRKTPRFKDVPRQPVMVTRLHLAYPVRIAKI